METENGPKKAYTTVYESLKDILDHDIYKTVKISPNFSPPHYSISDVNCILKDCEELFKSEPVQLEIDQSVTVVGDIHGHLFDLLRIFQRFGLPPQTKYLFLGDLVDRGEFSVETVLYICTLKLLFPTDIYLIRGNHEFDSLCRISGFYDDVQQLYSSNEVYDNFLNLFQWLPISAIVAKNTLCIHGGLGPQLYSLSQLKELKRPIQDFGDPVLDSILWSDPVDGIDFFEPSTRGSGFFFGKPAVDEFIKSQNIERIIRGHECVAEGCLERFDATVVTVFSASNYCGLVNNKAAIAKVGADGSYSSVTLAPLPYILRVNAITPKLSSRSFVANNNQGKSGVETAVRIDKIRRCSTRVNSFGSMPPMKPSSSKIRSDPPTQNRISMLRRRNSTALIPPVQHQRQKPQPLPHVV